MDLSPTGFGVAATIACSEPQTAPTRPTTPPITTSRSTLDNPETRDIMLPTINSYILAQRIPEAQLIVYPDSGHGSLFQYPSLFVAHVSRFLAAEPDFT
jgi:pimeloyl-ACP methyl ester carboxylesterase